ncbi:GNAT family N-acetyltransferase [Risungbinella massiliensis]|uniref:GNAT family N-acetyltransferase n=1 Tax=Risungbinella massiliensis TaxID=1329796 RepID=UPI00069B8E7D|nr:GNAT family N-acetyltransferase [Risungbinella massiliensis]
MIQIRKAVPTDIDGILQIYQKETPSPSPFHIESEQDFFIPSPSYNKNTPSPIQSIEGWWVALDQEYIVGVIGGELIDYINSEIFDLMLHPNRRGEGIGTQLLKTLTEQHIAQGACEQWVSIDKNFGTNAPFCIAQGFEYVPETLEGAKEWGIVYRYKRTIGPMKHP